MNTLMTKQTLCAAADAVFSTLDGLANIGVVEALNGSQGSNRVDPEKCQIRATHDLEAIQCWLTLYVSSERTHRHYQKEAERLLLWCLLQQKKPLSSLDVEDIQQYQLFLANPKPHNFWCAPKGSKRGSKNWRPFEKGLGRRSREITITILNSLFSYLVKARYLDFNPFSLLPPAKNTQHDQELRQAEVMERILAPDEWQAILETLDVMPENSEKLRKEKLWLKSLVYLLFFLGLRISELEQSSWQAFRIIDGRWWFFVVGKGGRFGKIPVHHQLLDCIRLYRVSFLGLSPLPTEDDSDLDLPIFYNAATHQSFTSRYMNYRLKHLALKASVRFETQPHKIEKLGKFSAHWLRHLSASMQDQAGIAFKHIQANHRHLKDNTTRLYVHAFDAARHEDIQKLKLNM